MPAAPQNAPYDKATDRGASLGRMGRGMKLTAMAAHKFNMPSQKIALAEGVSVRSPAFLHLAGQTSAVFLDRIVQGQFEIGNRLAQLQARSSLLHQSPLSWSKKDYRGTPPAHGQG